MADDKVIRQARQFADEKRGDGRGNMTTDEFLSAYTTPPTEVDFPIGFMTVALVIDGVDIFAAASVAGSVPWAIFSLLIFLPFEIWYVNQREEKYSSFKIEGELSLAGLNNLKRLSGKAAQVKRLESKVQELSKEGKTAEAAKLAGNLKRILPPWLKYLIAISDKIPFIQVIPGNSFLLLLSYYDNKESVRAIQEGIKLMAGNVDFKITRVAGSK